LGGAACWCSRNPGGGPLERLLGRLLEIAPFLRIAVLPAAAIGLAGWRLSLACNRRRRPRLLGGLVVPLRTIGKGGFRTMISKGSPSFR
jgi:hypothetical protein